MSSKHDLDTADRAFEQVRERSPDPDQLENPAAHLVTATRHEIDREARRVPRGHTTSDTDVAAPVAGYTHHGVPTLRERLEAA